MVWGRLNRGLVLSEKLKLPPKLIGTDLSFSSWFIPFPNFCNNCRTSLSLTRHLQGTKWPWGKKYSRPFDGLRDEVVKALTFGIYDTDSPSENSYRFEPRWTVVFPSGSLNEVQSQYRQIKRGINHCLGLIARGFPCLESFELVNVWKALKADYGNDLTHQQEERYGCYYKQLLIIPNQACNYCNKLGCICAWTLHICKASFEDAYEFHEASFAYKNLLVV